MKKSFIAAALAVAAVASPAASAAASAPEATTEEAIRVSGTAATLTGTIDTGNSDTTYAFRYGNSGTSYEEAGEYEHGTESEELSANGSPARVSVIVTGLEPETTYHFRLVALNEAGGSLGEDLTVTTTASYAPVLGLTKMPKTLVGSYAGQGVYENLGGEPIFSIEGIGQVKCNTAALFGPSAIAEYVSSFSLWGVYGGCTLAGTKASINTGNCHYAYGVDGGPPVYSGSVGIECSPGGAIAITMPNFGDCVVRVPAQSPSAGVTYATEGLGAESVVHAAVSAEGLTFTVDNPNGNFFCSLISQYGTSMSFSPDLVLYGGEKAPYAGAFIAGDEVS